MIKNKKIIIGILLLVIVVIATIVLIPKGKKYKETIFLGSTAKVKVEEGKIKLTYEDVKVRKQRTKILCDNSILDGYILSNIEPSSDQENTIHAYNNNHEIIICEPTLIAFTPDLDINYIKMGFQYYDDINTVYNNIYKEIININNTKIDYFIDNSFDYDKDGIQEHIYSMGLIENESRYDCLVVMFKDNKYYVINEITGVYDEENTRLELVGILDINNDSNLEFIISKINEEYGSIYYDFYNFNGSSFNKLSVD